MHFKCVPEEEFGGGKNPLIWITLLENFLVRKNVGLVAPLHRFPQPRGILRVEKKQFIDTNCENIN